MCCAMLFDLEGIVVVRLIVVNLFFYNVSLFVTELEKFV